MRLIKIMLGVILTLIILVGGLLAAAVIFIDPNDYKPEIAAAVKEQTGRELNIGGSIELALFPRLGLELNDVSLGNAPGFSDPIFARISRAELWVNLMPLIEKRVEVGTIVPDGLQLNLERLKNGSASWDDLAGSRQTSGTPSPDKKVEPSTAEPGTVGLAALAVDGIRITGGFLSFKDGTSDNQATLENLTLTISEIGLKTPFEIAAGFDLKNTQPTLTARTDLSGKATVDPEAGTYAFSNMDLHLAGTGATFPGGSMELSAKGDLLADLGKQLLNLTGLNVTTYGLNMTGKIAGTSILTSPTFNGALSLAEFSPRKLIASLGQPAPATADPEALTSAKANLVFTAGPTNAELTSLILGLDETTISGTGSVRNFARPAIAFTLSGDAIDADRYLPPQTTGKSKETAPSKTAPTGPVSSGASKTQVAAVPLPIDQLRTLDLKGKVTLGKLKINNLQLADLLMNLTAKNGLITMDPVSTNLYQGGFKGKTILDVRGNVPAVTVTETLTGMQVGPLLKDMTGKDTLTGTTRSTATLSTSGLTPDAMKANLSGNLSFGFENGSIKGINIPKMLRDGVTRIKGGTPDPSEVNETDFSSLTGSAVITKGVVDNRDLLMMSPLMRVNGEGTVNLAAESLDYLLKATVVKSLKGQKGEPLAELAGLTAPIRISGSFDNPKFGLDMAALLKETAVQKGVEELQKKVGEDLLKDKIPEGLQPQKLLKGLF